MSPKAQTAPQRNTRRLGYLQPDECAAIRGIADYAFIPPEVTPAVAADDRQRLEARIAAARETGAALATEVVTTAKKLGRPAEKNRPAPKGTRSILEWAKKPEVKVEVEDKKIVKTEPQP